MTNQTLQDGSTGHMIEDAFKALGVDYGLRIPDPSAIGIIVLGWSGEGKTHWVSSIPDSLIFEFTDSASSVVNPKAHRVFIKTWDQYEKLRTALLNAAKTGKCPYRSVAFDTVDEWFNILADKVIADYNASAKRKASSIGEVGREGKGFAMVGLLMESELRNFLRAGIGWVVTGHLQSREESLGDGKITVTRPVLTPSSFTRVVRLAYVRAQLVTKLRHTERQKKMGKWIEVQLPAPKQEKFLRLSTNQAGDEIKVKLNGLPEMIPFPRHGGWGVFVEAYREAASKCEAENSGTPAQD